MTIQSSSQVASIFVRRCLENSTSGYQKSLERLSSGSKFTSMGDDPVNYSKSEKISVEISSNNQFRSNIQIGEDMLSTAEGYQEVILSNVQRIHDLTLQINNGTYTDENIDSIIQEIQARLDNINAISENTEFNGTKILNGSVPDLTLKIGNSSTDTVNIGSVLTNVSTGVDGLNIDLKSTMTKEDWSEYLGNLDNASTLLTNNCAKIGALTSRLDFTCDKLTATKTDLAEFKSNIYDTDTAEECSNMINYQVMQEASTYIFIHVNEASQLVYSLYGASSQ